MVVVVMVLVDLIVLVPATIAPSTRMWPHLVPDVQHPANHTNVSQCQSVQLFCCCCFYFKGTTASLVELNDGTDWIGAFTINLTEILEGHKTKSTACN